MSNWDFMRVVNSTASGRAWLAKAEGGDVVKDVEAVLLRIPGVTDAQVFAKVLVRCQFPMSTDTIMGLKIIQDWIERDIGWKVEVTVSAGKERIVVDVSSCDVGSGCFKTLAFEGERAD